MVNTLSFGETDLIQAARAGDESAFDSLDAPVSRVAALDTPMPYNKHLEHASLPSAGDIIKAAEQLM